MSSKKYIGKGKKDDCKKPKIWNPNTKRCVNDTKLNRNKGAKTVTNNIEQSVCGYVKEDGKRCTKNGKFRMNECEHVNDKCRKKQTIKKNTKIKSKPKSVKKICPSGKILNPRTNRCINDNLANRRKIEKEKNVQVINRINEEEGSNINIMTNQCSLYDNIKDIDISKVEFIDISDLPDSEKCYSENSLKLIRKALIPEIKKNYLIQPNTDELNKQVDKKLKNLINTKLIYNDPITNNRISLCDQKFLNKGSYGSVYLYYNNNYKVAIKQFKRKNDSELRIIEKLNRLNLNCKLINSKVIERGKGSNLEKYAVMEIMHGGLNKMNGKLDKNTVWKVIKNIAEHLNCLNDNNLAYTDLKTANILFKCKNKKNLDIYLGDLGSICNRGQTNVSTWMPWETSRGLVTGVRCNEHTMVWQLGIVFLELLKWRKYIIFSWQTIKNFTPEQITKYFDEIVRVYKLNDIIFKNNENSKYKNAGDLFRAMVKFETKDRCKLSDIISSIKL
jgi:hypothetical protein